MFVIVCHENKPESDAFGEKEILYILENLVVKSCHGRSQKSTTLYAENIDATSVEAYRLHRALCRVGH